MAQVTGHEVDGKGDHYLTLDDGSQLVVPRKDVVAAGLPDNAGWGQVLALVGHSAGGVFREAPKPKGKTRSG